mgnify:CR=1 FL=1
MNNIFNPDNKFFSFMGRVADLMILNLLCIVCCIPVVTAGPAIAAMYYITLKMARNEESYVVKGFFHSFKQNLKQGIVIQIIMLLLGIYTLRITGYNYSILLLAVFLIGNLFTQRKKYGTEYMRELMFYRNKPLKRSYL